MKKDPYKKMQFENLRSIGPCLHRSDVPTEHFNGDKSALSYMLSNI